MKSQSLKSVVIRLYEAILKDLSYIDPSILTGGRVSLLRLTRLLISRGETVLTIALPDICKYLERGLADGRLPESRPPCAGRYSVEDERPRLFHEFWVFIFDSEGVLLDVPSSDAIAGLRQLLLVFKKVRSECASDKVDSALAEFIEVDESLPHSWPDTWDEDKPIWVPRHGHPLWGVDNGDPEQLNLLEGPINPNRESDWVRMRRIAGIVLSSFGDELSVLELKPRHGPGAVAERVREKYTFQHWPRKLEGIFPQDWFASANAMDELDLGVSEPPSRVICVPKTMKGPRIIAAEPISHQWCQGAVMRYLEDAIGRSLIAPSIDLRDQEKSQRMALEASITGEAATIDLSSASDRLSTRLVEFIFQSRRDILDVLHASRTRLFQMPDGSIHRANKFACMGSACTFPIQTIVFTIVGLTAMGVNPTRRDIRDASRLIRVFGDDIILPTSAYGSMVDLLTEVGLKVNTAKSFGTGRFREACGVDAFSGVNVTPAYVLETYNPRKPESLASIVASSNNFHKKGYWNAADVLLKTVDPVVRKNLRIAARDVCLPCVFSYSPSERHLKVRFNPDTQVMEVRSLVLDVKVERQAGGGEAMLREFLFERGEKALLDVVLAGERPRSGLGPASRPKRSLALRWVLLEDRYSDDL
jgi:hypothetical protein